ncbi:hypothetical protein Q9L58_001524 [Maublancomyces gigas]|uniref:Uncharacterized protein n=1 Tax=Discina gigas TaxID=1032678 RepID=A0ABR3GUA1_9PEZI
MSENLHAVLSGMDKMNLDDSLDANPNGSLGMLDANVMLLHLAPFLGLADSISLANTNHHYRGILLHHAMGHNTIPAGRSLTTTFPLGVLSAIRHIDIGLSSTVTDTTSILWGNRLPALRSLTISSAMGGFLNVPTVGAPGLANLHTLNINSTTASTFLAHPDSAGILQGLRSLVISADSNGIGPSQFPLPEDLFRALGSSSQLNSLSITSDSFSHCSIYHAAILALLSMLSLPETTPPKLALFSLSFRDRWHNPMDGTSLIVEACKSHLANNTSSWKLGHILASPLFPRDNNKPWGPGSDPNCFLLTQAELDDIIELDKKASHHFRLTNFFGGPVVVAGTKLGHVGLLGTALRGIECDMSRHEISPAHFCHSFTSIALHFMADPRVTVDPTQLLESAAPNLRSIELLSAVNRARYTSNFLRVHELFKIPSMPMLQTLRIDCCLLLEEGERGSCGSPPRSHKAARYALAWIPTVPELRLEGWCACVGCWKDCSEGTMRKFVENGAGGAGMVTIRGTVRVRAGFNSRTGKQEMGFGKIWEVRFMG